MSDLISVKKLKLVANPFSHSPWWYKIPFNLVRKCIDNNIISDKPVNINSKSQKHASRIAYFVLNPEKLKDPILVDVGCPSLGYNVDWIIIDGNHRVSAAIFTELDFINADISGEEEYIKLLF